MVNNLLDEVAIVGGGIGGLTLALALHQVGIRSHVYEAAPELRPLGVGLNLLPHAVRELWRLGLERSLLSLGIETQEYLFYTRAGQLVYSEPRGAKAGYSWPQISIHRGDLHSVLLDEVKGRLGADAISLNHRCVGVSQDSAAACVLFEAHPPAYAGVVVACDGIHSIVRSALHAGESRLRYEGTTQYRGVSRLKPFHGGASMAYLGTNRNGKLVVYPIRNNIDDTGRQLINWVVEIEQSNTGMDREWTKRASADDFVENFANCNFDWLDVPAMIRAADEIYQYPMVDQEPLDQWTKGRITLLGDAAHAMMPRGSNGAAQAIIDATTLAALLAESDDPQSALAAYEAKRRPATSQVVMANRSMSPDAILNVIEQRTGGRKFDRIEEVISQEELAEWQERYKAIAGFAARDLTT